MALAAGIQKDDFRTFVIVGDGCLNEGQTWEAIMAAAKFQTPGLVLMVDYNRVQLDGPSRDIMPMDPLIDKLKAFNWNVSPQCYDGHNVNAILDSWDWIGQQDQGPIAVVYQTHKGHAVSFTKDQSKWHGAPIDPDSYVRGRAELLSTLNELEGMI